MSRTLVRAALAQLQSEGLVDAPPRRTATTAKPTLEEAQEVFEVRRMLEREVVRLVIARWKPEFGAELEGPCPRRGSRPQGRRSQGIGPAGR